MHDDEQDFKEKKRVNRVGGRMSMNRQVSNYSRAMQTGGGKESD